MLVIVYGSDSLIKLEMGNHPAKGYIPPAAFIPLAEEMRVIIPIGDWVLWNNWIK